MIPSSLKNFQSTYAQVIKLVLKNDKKELIVIASTYLLSIAFLGAAFVVLLALVKSIVVSGDFSFSKYLEIQVFGFHYSVSQAVGLGLLLALYLFSSFTTYLVEKRWYLTIQKIVNSIVLESNDTNCKEIRVGAIATIRVSAILLVVLSPALIAMASFMLLVYFDWRMASLTIIIGSLAIYLYLLLGRTTKRISTSMSSEDDDDSEDATYTDPAQQDVNGTPERLNFIANLLQLKSKSRLISNVLFVCFVVGTLTYFTFIKYDVNSAYQLIVSSGLIYLCFNGMKIVGSKAVPLSRQYNLVRDFIAAAK